MEPAPVASRIPPKIREGPKMSDIVLSASVRQNLLSLQSTADLLATTQNRLATGKKVNTALDNPTNYFTAAALDNRANDINTLLDGIGRVAGGRGRVACVGHERKRVRVEVDAVVARHRRLAGIVNERHALIAVPEHEAPAGGLDHRDPRASRELLAAHDREGLAACPTGGGGAHAAAEPPQQSQHRGEGQGDPQDEQQRVHRQCVSSSETIWVILMP